MRFTQVELLDRIVPQRPSWRRHVVAALQVLGLAAGVVAIARPVDTSTERIGSEGRIMLLFDVSSSMSASDVVADPARRGPAGGQGLRRPGRHARRGRPDLLQRRVVVDVARRSTATRSTSAIDNIQLATSTAIGDALVGRHAACWCPWPATAGHRPPMRRRSTGPPPGRSCC